MRILTLVSALILLLVVVSCVRDLKASLTKQGGAVSWQQSAAPQIQLGARDKYGALGSYEAIFIVKDQHHHEYRTRKAGVKDNWTYAYFPMDFPIADIQGKYTWRCMVQGNVIGTGAFTMSFDSLKIR